MTTITLPPELETAQRHDGKTTGQTVTRENVQMPHARLSGEEIARLGEEIYARHLREQVETDENIGKIIAIDVETGAYEIDDDLLAAGRRVQALHPDAALWTKRIGYNAVYAVGGTLTRTTP